MWRGLATTSTVFDVVGSMRAALMRELGLVSKQRRTFSAEFKREAAPLVLDQGYSHIDACRSLGRPCAVG